MTEPYFTDGTETLWHGDALDVLRAMPAASVDCCVTSPPYFGLRDYGIDGQYGLEATPAEYVETMRALFAEVRRVLANDGTLWLNIGDSYADSKSLMGIPWRVAIRLDDDGWTLRNDVIWHKPNGLPESIRDRLTMKHEHVFMFSKSRRYWFDVDAIAVERTAGPPRKVAAQKHQARGDARVAHNAESVWVTGGYKSERKNPGDVWLVSTQPFGDAHFACMPIALAERAVMAGCRPGGVVLDPFSGSGTTGLAATKHGRRYVGIDISRDYLDLSLRTRFAQPGLDFSDVTA